MKIAFRHPFSRVGRRGKNRFLLHIFPKIISFTPKYTRMNLSARDKETKRLFEKYAKDLCSYALGFLGNAEDAEDAVQDVFMRFWENTDARFADEKAAKTYLYNSVRNACLNQLKLKEIHAEVLEKVAPREEPSEDEFFAKVVRAEVYREIMAAIDELPRECGKVFRLACVDGLSNDEVAQKLGISVNTVKVQKNRAKIQLRARLKDLYPLLLLFLKMV